MYQTEKQTHLFISFHLQIFLNTNNFLSSCVSLLPQVNGISKPSSLGLIWESLWPCCSFSPKTTKTEDAQMSVKCCGREESVSATIENKMFPHVSRIIQHQFFKACNRSALFALSYHLVRERFPLCVTAAAFS